MRNELIFQHNIVLEYEEINYEFEMLRLLLQEAKKSGFRNKFRDLEEYIDMRFQGISEVMAHAGFLRDNPNQQTNIQNL